MWYKFYCFDSKEMFDCCWEFTCYSGVSSANAHMPSGESPCYR